MAEQMQGVLPASAIQSSVSPELAVMAPAPVNPSATPAAENIQPPASAPPEKVSETLYIQNLNERVKLDGKTSLDNSHIACELTEMILNSDEADSPIALQKLRRSARCRGPQQFEDARTGIRIVCRQGHCQEGATRGQQVPALLETHGASISFITGRT